MALGKVCIHGAKSTRVVRPCSPRHRATLVRETAAREGWAYATVLSAPGVRIVTDSIGGPVAIVGSKHFGFGTSTSRRRLSNCKNAAGQLHACEFAAGQLHDGKNAAGRLQKRTDVVCVTI